MQPYSHPAVEAWEASGVEPAEGRGGWLTSLCWSILPA